MIDDAVEDELETTDTLEIDPAAAESELKRRCREADIELSERPGFQEGEKYFEIAIRSGRETRPILVSSFRLKSILDVRFEEFTFLSGYEAICSYNARTIEVGVSVLGSMSPSFALRKLFPRSREGSDWDSFNLGISLDPPSDGLPSLQLGAPTSAFESLVRMGVRRLTLKLFDCNATSHDEAVSILRKTANGLFFQIDLYSDIPLSLERQRRRRPLSKKARDEGSISAALQFPRTEFDEAPMSLYWYARSAGGMPLLQFLAFYQAIEFYFPTYSKAEAARRLKAVLKDPTFRGDRDADIGRLLAAIQAGRGSAFGDERSQLRATILECVDADALRAFITADPVRAEFFSSKSKTPSLHKISVANPTADLRPDVAERIYDIRCKVVHTKNDSREGELELLLPFTKEADQLSHDIELVQYIAQRVLIAASIEV